jgi:hypothetical protein
MKEKENVLKDYKKMIVNSWTYKKMTAEEQIQLFKMFDSIQTREALKGSYNQRWEILQALYNSFLLALNYEWNWREENAEKLPF